MITRALSEKLQLFADLAESVIGPEEAASRSRLLLRGDAPDLQQGETLLKGAITEGTLTPGFGLAVMFLTASGLSTLTPFSGEPPKPAAV